MSSPVEPLTPEETAQAEQRALHEGWLHKVLVSVDQTANVFLGGDPDETLSAHAARAAEAGSEFGAAVCKFLGLFQNDHGPLAQAGDEARAEQIETLEMASGGVAAAQDERKSVPST